MIGTDTRQCPACPDKECHNYKGFQEKPYPAGEKRPAEAAQEKGGRHSRCHKHITILGQIKQRITHTRILGIDTCRQLTLTLGQVKRRTVALGDCRDYVNDKSDRLQADQPDMLLLISNNVHHIECTCHHHHTQDGEALRYLIADGLIDHTHTADQSILIIGSIARQQHRQRSTGGCRHDIDDAQLQIQRHHTLAKGDSRHSQHRRHKNQQSRQQMYRLIGLIRHDVLLHHQLDSIGNRLQPAVGAQTIGAGPPLDIARQLALPDNVKQRDQHTDHHDTQPIYRHHSDINQSIRQPQPGYDPSKDKPCQRRNINKYIVNKLHNTFLNSISGHNFMA